MVTATVRGVSTARGLDRLGCYVLPGGVPDPRPGLLQAKAAEDLGFGTAWISERYDTKDLPALVGAIGQVTARIRIAAGITHPGLRHPMVLASMGQTLQALTGERFALGLGRSALWRWQAYGVPAPTLGSLGDTADILRRLWAGETVAYDGPLGTFPALRLAQRPDVAPPPVLLAAVGPKTLALAGDAFDGVILHPFLTPDAVHRSVGIVRDAARSAGRDPECIALLRDRRGRHPTEIRETKGSRLARVPRATSNFAGWATRWSRPTAGVRATSLRTATNPHCAELGDRSADKNLSRDELIELSRAMPADWLPSASAVGSVQTCATRLHEYLDAGADEIVLHGSTAEHLDRLAVAFGAP